MADKRDHCMVQSAMNVELYWQGEATAEFPRYIRRSPRILATHLRVLMVLCVSWLLAGSYNIVLPTPTKMFVQSLILLLTISMTISAPAPHPEPNPAPAADPAAKPALTPLVYSPPVAVSYNAFSTLQTHPSSLIVKSAPAVVPAIQSLPTVYTLQAQAAPALGYAVNYPYVVV